jgi:hypothetical protein
MPVEQPVMSTTPMRSGGPVEEDGGQGLVGWRAHVDTSQALDLTPEPRAEL